MIFVAIEERHSTRRGTGGLGRNPADEDRGQRECQQVSSHELLLAVVVIRGTTSGEDIRFIA
jgi:hypothetical protein